MPSFLIISAALSALAVLYYVWARWGRQAYLRIFRQCTGITAACAAAATAADVAAGAPTTLIALDAALLALTGFATLFGPRPSDSGTPQGGPAHVPAAAAGQHPHNRAA